MLVHPGEEEARLLRAFELAWDGKLNWWEKPAVGSADEAEQQQKAAAAIAWLGDQVRRGVVQDALVLANHPMRLGVDSPSEMRLWRDADRHIMIGMEGSPGAQGYPAGKNVDPGDPRGEYVNKPRPDSWPGYILDMYRPYGGFDWMTATVGGLWDSMPAEGLPFFLTATSDNHLTAWDTWRIGATRTASPTRPCRASSTAGPWRASARTRSTPACPSRHTWTPSAGRSPAQRPIGTPTVHRAPVCSGASTPPAAAARSR